MPARPTPTPRSPAATGAARTAPPSTSAADARRLAVRLTALAALTTLAGCADHEKARADSAAIAATLAPPPGPPPASDCPRDGRWRACNITKRLQDAGLVPHQLPDTTRVPFLTPAAASWTVSKVDLRVFLYDSAAQADREALALDPIRVAPRGGSYAWPAPATLVHSGNLIAVLLSDNARQVERVQLALEAGPPQPEGPAQAQPLAPTTSH